MKIKLLSSFIALCCLLAMLNSCGKEFTCTDGEQNQGELGIDCGGPCDACGQVATCTDGIQNGGETGIDCGGSCPNPCSTAPTCTDGVQNGTETGVDCGGTCPACGGTGTTGTFTAKIDGTPFTATNITAINTGGKLNITASNGTTTLSLVHDAAFLTGNYPFGSTAPAIYTQGAIGCTHNSGSITFNTFNTTTKLVTGSFEFGCTDASGGTGNHSITEGTFANVSYN